MERLAAFTLKRPDSLARAIELLAGTPGARAIAGGTDLVPALRHGFGAPRCSWTSRACRGSTGST